MNEASHVIDLNNIMKLDNINSDNLNINDFLNIQSNNNNNINENENEKK